MAATQRSRQDRGRKSATLARAGLVVALGVALLLVASCGSTGNRAAVEASERKATSSPYVSRGRFLVQTDQICQRFHTERDWLSAAFGLKPDVEPSPEREANYFRALVPSSQAYMTALAAVDAPPHADELINAAMVDAYVGMYLLLEAVATYEQSDLVQFAVASDRVTDHFSGHAPTDARLRAYGFESCGAVA